MSRKSSIGDLPPRHGFLLNPYRDLRLSKCPTCDRPTHPRKFVLLIHIESCRIPLALGKTCRYCTPCELIIAHRDELEAELARCVARVAPGSAWSPYLVLGTVDKTVWKKSLEGEGTTFEEAMRKTAEFARVLELKVEGGWSLPPSAPDA